jgi:hypothetical protein
MDIVDYDYLKYMKTAERGIDLPQSVKRYKTRRGTEAPSLRTELETLNLDRHSNYTKKTIKNPRTM